MVILTVDDQMIRVIDSVCYFHESLYFFLLHFQNSKILLRVLHIEKGAKQNKNANFKKRQIPLKMVPSQVFSTIRNLNLVFAILGASKILWEASFYSVLYIFYLFFSDFSANFNRFMKTYVIHNYILSFL